MLSFENFIICFRKQFIFQIGHGGRRISRYYTAQNAEQGLHNDQWAIMCFIYAGTRYGFSDKEMIEELKIKQNLYDVLKEEIWLIVNTNYSDKKLQNKVLCKIKLIENCIAYTHRVKVGKEVSFS